MHLQNAIKIHTSVNKTNDNKHLMMVICQPHSMHLQKEVKSNPKTANL